MTCKKVAIVGLGYVGLPLATRCLEVGHQVLAFDVNPTKGELAKEHLTSQLSMPESSLDRFTFSSSSEIIADAEVVIICVPTPLLDGNPDFRHLVDASNEVAKHLALGAVVVLESTTSPGTTEGLLYEAFESHGRKLDEDYFLGYSPERLNLGPGALKINTVPKIVAGATDSSLSKVLDFYSTVFDQVIPATSIKVAEATKLFENAFRLVNIALVNEFARACYSLGIRATEALDLAETKPFGFTRFEPGLGAGGHCIPVDPSYLTHYLDEINGHQMNLLVHATSSNRAQPYFISNWIRENLELLGVKCKGLKFGLVGVSYKADVPDLRESTAVALSSILRGEGHCVIEFDDFALEQRDIRPLGEIGTGPEIDVWIVALPLSKLFTEEGIKPLEVEQRKGVPIFDLTGKLPLARCLRL